MSSPPTQTADDKINKLVALDLETFLIEDGILAPEIVCGSLAYRDLSQGGTLETRLLYPDEAVEEARRILSGDLTMVLANGAFDLGCLIRRAPDLRRLVFRAFAEGRVYDVLVAQKLHAIAEGHLGRDPATGRETSYSLDTCTRMVLGRDDAKDRDFWRKRYALLAGLLHEMWPDDARRYPQDDAANTLLVAEAQMFGGGEGCTPGPHRNLGEQNDQTETAFGMHLGALWGLRTDRVMVDALREKNSGQLEAFIKKMAEEGFYKFDKAERKWKQDVRAVKRAVVFAYGGGTGPCPICKTGDGQVLSPKTGKAVQCKDCSGTGLDLGPAPRTPTGGVARDRDTKMESGEPALVALGDNEPEKILDTYLPFVEKGLDRPLTLSPNVLVESFRTSYYGVIQLLPRDGGVRECIRARGAWCGSPDEYVLCSVDYSSGEMCTLAQVCYDLFGYSQLRETINATGDPGMLHTALGAGMRGWTTEEMVAAMKSKDPDLKAEAKKYRQAAKALNFGLPGGMGAAKLVFSKRKKNEGTTTAADGFVYPGIRFCVLLGGEARCGVEKVTKWKDRDCPAVCRRCVELVEFELRPAWFKQWPEMADYFKWVNRIVDEGQGPDYVPGEFPRFRSDAVRGGLGFTAGANNGFQNLLAQMAKYALRGVVRECYDVEDSPLFGARPIFFVHDEVMSEMLARRAHEAALRKSAIMVDAGRVYCPDVTVRADPALMRFWLKIAEPHYVDGRLVPWDDYNEWRKA